MKTAEAKPKKFSTVEQIYKSYIPNYSPQKTTDFDLNGKAGIQLAKKLLNKFRDEIKVKKEAKSLH